VTPKATIIGAGPAGLTAAHVMSRAGMAVHVLEADHIVGGIARTVEYRGFRFDIGGHRFFTKVRAVEDLWRRMLGPDLIERPRLSRIYYDGRYFDYPLKAGNAMRGLGPWRMAAIAASYARAKIAPVRPEVSFEDWVVNRFGRRLYETFFKSYTEKVWGIPCTEITAQWAAQRIKGLSLWTAAREMLRGGGGSHIRTLIDRFTYPRLGPGMMWEAFARDLTARPGNRLTFGAHVSRIHHAGGRVTAVEYDGPGGPTLEPVASLISTMPLRQLVEALAPAAPAEVLAAARQLKYRDFFTVALIIDQADVFPDNWIYIHDPGVKLGRVQNFKNWSPEMVPDLSKTCLGLEYFCFEGDGLWTMPDRDLIAMGRRELGVIGLVDPSRVVDGTVVRMPKAYPVYDRGYEQGLDRVRAYLATFANLQAAGRNGLHKYNNQDHSMVTAMLAASALMGGKGDPWLVNVEDDYHETGDDLSQIAADLPALLAAQPAVPISVQSSEFKVQSS
jgi:protoporphyrinogen oxidase